ncbi:MAG: PAQR family membrane homeostasis protein TrhA [Flavobacteriaceae bacterium]
MKKISNPKYSKKEEKLNVLTHAFGLIVSIVGLPFLLLKSLQYNGFWKPFSIVIFGVSLIVLYAASTFYHASKDSKLRRKLNIFDHAAIYFLIAGTYSPFTIIILDGSLGWLIFSCTWVFAFVGIVLKFFFTGRYDKLSTAMYILMGWQIILVIKPLMNAFSINGLKFLFAGGVFYTVGALLYSSKKITYNHAIFHVFVLLGSTSHFICIYKYI